MSGVHDTITPSTLDPDTAYMINEIRAEFKKINSLPLRKETYKVASCADGNDPGGTITYYLTDSGEIVKVLVEWPVLSNHSVVSEYYYKNEQVVFRYESVVRSQAHSPEGKTEYRFYIKNNILIRYMENQKIAFLPHWFLDADSNEYVVLAAFTSKDFSAVLCR